MFNIKLKALFDDLSKLSLSLSLLEAVKGYCAMCIFLIVTDWMHVQEHWICTKMIVHSWQFFIKGHKIGHFLNERNNIFEKLHKGQQGVCDVLVNTKFSLIKHRACGNNGRGPCYGSLQLNVQHLSSFFHPLLIVVIHDTTIT